MKKLIALLAFAPMAAPAAKLCAAIQSLAPSYALNTDGNGYFYLGENCGDVAGADVGALTCARTYYVGQGFASETCSIGATSAAAQPAPPSNLSGSRGHWCRFKKTWICTFNGVAGIGHYCGLVAVNANGTYNNFLASMVRLLSMD
jgi:hypothetical protein